MIVGTALAIDVRPLRIERGIVWIGVSNAPQASHLQYLKPMLLRRIRERYPDTTIRDIRIVHRPEDGRRSK
jgi:hypothetical protein